MILRKKDSLNNILRKYIHRYKYMLNEANIIISKDSRVELSHHKGVKNLEKIGALLVTLINGVYCKKIIALFPKQKHPTHKHYKKVVSVLLLGHSPKPRAIMRLAHNPQVQSYLRLHL